MRTYCVSLDVKGALTWSRRDLAKLLRHDDGRRMTGAEAQRALLDVLSRGVLMLPVGDCDNHDPQTGCRGHASTAAEVPHAAS